MYRQYKNKNIRLAFQALVKCLFSCIPGLFCFYIFIRKKWSKIESLSKRNGRGMLEYLECFSFQSFISYLQLTIYVVFSLSHFKTNLNPDDVYSFFTDFTILILRSLSLFWDLICHVNTKKPWCICQLITSKSTPLSSPPPPPPRTTHSTAVFSCPHSTSGEHFYVNVAANRLDGIFATKSGFGINISITGKLFVVHG